MSVFAAGALAIAVIVIGCYLGFTKDIPFTRGYRVEAVFASAASEIRVKSPVRIAGVNVGKVASVRRGPGGTAIVEMDITDAGRPLHRDATLKIRPRLFLEGNFFVDLKPGSSSEPELEDGDSVPITQTSIPVQFDELINVFTADTRTSFQDLLRGFADALDEGGAAAARRSFGEYEGAFRDTAVVMQALRGEQDGDLAAYVRDQARVSDALARNRTQLASLIGGFATTMTAFADHRDDLRATLRGIDDVLAVAPAALDATDAALPAIRRFAAAARPGLRVAPRALDHFHPFLRTLGRALAPSRLPAFARDLRPAAQGLADLDDRLPPLMRLVRRVSDCTTDNIIPALSKRVPDGHLSVDQPAWLEGIHSTVGLVGSQANFDGNGTHTRYYGLAGGPDIVSTQLTDDLVSLSDSPLVGSRPSYTPGRQPPLDGDAPCEDQAVPDLESPSTAPPANQRRIRLKPAKPWSPRQRRHRLRSAFRSYAGAVR